MFIYAVVTGSILTAATGISVATTIKDPTKYNKFFCATFAGIEVLNAHEIISYYRETEPVVIKTMVNLGSFGTAAVAVGGAIALGSAALSGVSVPALAYAAGSAFGKLKAKVKAQIKKRKLPRLPVAFVKYAVAGAMTAFSAIIASKALQAALADTETSTSCAAIALMMTVATIANYRFGSHKTQFALAAILSALAIMYGEVVWDTLPVDSFVKVVSHIGTLGMSVLIALLNWQGATPAQQAMPIVNVGGRQVAPYGHDGANSNDGFGGLVTT